MRKAKVIAYDLERLNPLDYKALRPDEQEIYDYADSYDIYLESVMNMFNYYGFPASVKTEFLERYRLQEGMAAVGIFSFSEGNPVAVRVKLVGERDTNGIGIDAIVTSDNGESEYIDNWRDDDNMVVSFLNRIYTPDLTLKKAAYFDAEADKSINAILNLARYSKILPVEDTNEQTQLEKALDNIRHGKIATFIHKRKRNPLNGIAEPDMQPIELTDVRNNDMIQYLSKYKDDLRRQTFSKYGMSVMGSSKMAQMSEEEINVGSNLAMVIPHGRYELLQKFADECNQKFGWECSIEFSECWQNEFAKCRKDKAAEMEVDDDVIEPEG